MRTIVHSARIEDRDGGVMLMGALFGRYPSLLKLYADSGYQGPKFQEGLKKFCRKINVEYKQGASRSMLLEPAMI